MRKRSRENTQTTDVDMTPMLDIVFILLIFFIVTTSFIKEDAVVFKRPDSNIFHKDPKPIKPIVIDIEANNDITISGRFVDVDAIRANLETERTRNPKATVLVRVHENAASGIVVRAVDQSKLAGAGQVTVVRN